MKNQIFTFKNNAIGINLKGMDRLVYPYALLELLWNCHYRRRLCSNVEVVAQILPSGVYCYFFDDEHGSYRIEWPRDEFISNAKDVLNAYCDNRFLINEENDPYPRIKLPHAEILKKCINQIQICGNYSQTFIEEINLDDFTFEFVEEYACDTGYELNIGNMCYRSMLSDWSTDFNEIRCALESLCGGSSVIELHYEDSPVEIHCTRPNLFSKSKGCYHKEDIIKVTIYPDVFTEGPIRFGWCRTKDVVRELYLGALKLCTKETTWFDDDPYRKNWSDLRLAIYNKVQSCVIENFLLDIKEDDYTAYPRQRWIGSVEDLKTDYSNLCAQIGKK